MTPGGQPIVDAGRHAQGRTAADAAVLLHRYGIHPRDAFRRWREAVCDQFAPIELQPRDEVTFQGRTDFMSVGPMLISRSSHSGLRSVVTADALRRGRKDDQLLAVFSLSGQNSVQQGDREAVSRPGDLAVFDRRPLVYDARVSSGTLTLELPRAQVESMLGPSRLFCTLTAPADLAATTLANTFVRELMRIGEQLNPESAARMAAITIDLIVASLAERLAQEVPSSIHGTVTVQRAKAYVEANLGDPALDPPRLAAAVGVSLRRLQELFHARGRHISDYIWDRRLEAAAKRLADPACAHLAIGMIAYGCGFASQAHFARRFKARHGVTPREYRQVSLLGAP